MPVKGFETLDRMLAALGGGERAEDDAHNVRAFDHRVPQHPSKNGSKNQAKGHF